MKIELCPTVVDINKYPLTNSTAIAVDVLRATSCIITALASGSKGVTPVFSPEEAFKLKQETKGKVILGGERHSIKIAGFDLGNSPLEYQDLDLKESQVIITTTNGTRAIKEASMANKLLIGSILNAKATANQALAYGQPVTIICSGTKEIFSLDDFLAGGLIIKEIEKLTSVTLTDLALVAKLIAEHFADSIYGGLVQSKHGKELLEMGLKEDLIFCSQLNKFPLAALYENDEISVISQS